MKYDKDTDALIRSDIEEIRGEPVPLGADNGSLKALVLDFCLPSSTYATMALREILKADTSAAHQCRLQQSVTAKRVHDTNEPDQEATDSNDSKKPKLEAEIPA